jgi:hypothetical protein
MFDQSCHLLSSAVMAGVPGWLHHAEQNELKEVTSQFVSNMHPMHSL